MDVAADHATVILLSYARPQNMQPILETVLQAPSCGRIILCNNNPAIDITDHIDPAPDRLSVLQETERWPAVKRFRLAREAPGKYFLCIDDDLFLTAVQIEDLLSELRVQPDRPHGLWGANVQLAADGKGGQRLLLQGGIRNRSGPVRIINRVYAFTDAHVRRFFELLAALGIEDPRDLGPADDILLSFSGAAPPQMHDLGALRDCPTADTPGIALWTEPGFFDRRLQRLAELHSLFTAS